MRRPAAPQNSSSVSSAGVLAGNWGQGAHRFAQVGSLLGHGAGGEAGGWLWEPGWGSGHSGLAAPAALLCGPGLRRGRGQGQRSRGAAG